MNPAIPQATTKHCVATMDAASDGDAAGAAREAARLADGRRKQDSRFYEIDLFRFVAAFAVVLFHYTFRGHAAGGRCEVAYPLLGEVFRYGYLGVDLFFLISGFVILLTAMNKDFTGFAISRIVRLYPAFWAGVTFTAIVTVLLGGEIYSVGFKQYVLNLSMLGGYLGVGNVDTVYWTLLVELNFYLLIGLLLLLQRIDYIKVFLGFWLSLAFANLFVDLPKAITWLFILRWSSYFIAGALFYLIRREGISLYKMAGVAAAYGLSIKYAFWQLPMIERKYDATFSEWVVLGVITALYALMFLVSVKRTGILVRKEWLVLGALTYPLYLVHQNVGFMLLNALSPRVPKHLLLALVIGLVLAVAYLINRYIEKPTAGPLKNALVRITSRVSGATGDA